jgi:uncharacterized membrane protein
MNSNGRSHPHEESVQRSGLSLRASLLISEIELLLSEKRTALSVMRTGIAILALPLSVFSALIATSRFYTPGKVLYWIIPLLVLCAGLLAFALYLVVRAVRRTHALDHAVQQHKARFRAIAEQID